MPTTDARTASAAAHGSRHDALCNGEHDPCAQRLARLHSRHDKSMRIHPVERVVELLPPIRRRAICWTSLEREPVEHPQSCNTRPPEFGDDLAPSCGTVEYQARVVEPEDVECCASLASLRQHVGEIEPDVEDPLLQSVAPPLLIEGRRHSDAVWHLHAVVEASFEGAHPLECVDEAPQVTDCVFFGKRLVGRELAFTCCEQLARCVLEHECRIALHEGHVVSLRKKLARIAPNDGQLAAPVAIFVLTPRQPELQPVTRHIAPASGGRMSQDDLGGAVECYIDRLPCSDIAHGAWITPGLVWNLDRDNSLSRLSQRDPARIEQRLCSPVAPSDLDFTECLSDGLPRVVTAVEDIDGDHAVTRVVQIRPVAYEKEPVGPVRRRLHEVRQPQPALEIDDGSVDLETTSFLERAACVACRGDDPLAERTHHVSGGLRGSERLGPGVRLGFRPRGDEVVREQRCVAAGVATHWVA